MGLNAKKKEFNGGGKKADPIDAGAYPARLVQIIDLGVQEQQPFKGEPKPPAQELMTTYELVDEFMKDEDGEDIEDKPRWQSETFVLHNLASDMAKSTKRYTALDPNLEHDGDWTELVGSPVMVTITKDQGKGKNADKVYNNISGTSSMRAKEAAKLPELKNPAKIFDQSDISTVDIFFTLPQWIQDKIKSGLEFEGSEMEYAINNYKQKDSDEDAKQKGKGRAKKQEKAAEPDDSDEGDVGNEKADNGEDW